MVVDDRPGRTRSAFAAAGSADVNLEDVRIEHTVERLRAIIERWLRRMPLGCVACSARAAGDPWVAGD